MASPTIVVAEDDDAIRDLVVHHLEREGYAVHAVRDGLAALRAARSAADALILDLGLPGIDGLDVMRRLRGEGVTVPVLVVTARAEEIDRVVGLEIGADDYLCKPFGPRELCARVRAVLRRSGGAMPARVPVLRFGRMEIDEAAREVRVDGLAVPLKPREFALLLELARNDGRALSRDRLIENVWGLDYDGDERTVDVHVRRLRSRLEEPYGLPPFVLTLRGYGYKFVRP